MVVVKPLYTSDKRQKGEPWTEQCVMCQVEPLTAWGQGREEPDYPNRTRASALCQVERPPVG